ncbi:hypothetical protein [Nonomuraea sp. NEAU-A123]|uniref:hypothetical protein n=1 Tax=Nonomuraea sp. NEAU-A123 TaxID=2839649 RepID=UPI001BE4B734|nr:hypothetical protein [Nonomuraea sp. NEAU-A123]MBT2230120.1 hypothetical protein [Nonomuraea sp. NEAU-A123]
MATPTVSFRDLSKHSKRALVTSDEGALAVVFPWVRHLSDVERQEFVRDIVDSTRDVVNLDVYATLHRITAEWRATARILADPALAAQAGRPLPEEDYGEVFAP